MKHNLFNTITYWINNQKMTTLETREMRHILLDYATTHPVKSGLISPYTFKYIGVAFASLIIVLGTSVGITQASMKALPNQSLYGVKIWIEEFQVTNQKTPESKIAFETDRIKTRFGEAATLAMKHKLDDNNSLIIQSGLEHSRESVRSLVDSLQENNPEFALKTINSLETAFSSNGKILARIEQNTNQNIGIIVLAAEQTVEHLSLEKVKYEKIVALKPDSTTKETSEERLTALTEKLKTVPEITTISITPPPLETGVLPVVISTLPTTETTTGTTPVVVHVVPILEKEPTLNDLVAGAKEKIDKGSYSEALVNLQKAEQVIDEANLTKSLEKTYNVKKLNQ